MHGDYNMIYMAADKSNDALDRREMRCFRNFINSMLLHEIEHYTTVNL